MVEYNTILSAYIGIGTEGSIALNHRNEKNFGLRLTLSK